MEIELDVAALEAAARAYEVARGTFSEERDGLGRRALQLGTGWDAAGYLAFQRESSYMLSSVYSPGCEALGKAAKALGSASDRAKILCGKASLAAASLGGSASSPVVLKYSSSSADAARQYASYAEDDIDSIKRRVSSAVSVYLETTSCDLGEGALWSALSERRARLSRARSRLAGFEAGLSAFVFAMGSSAGAVSASPGLVVGGARAVYAGGTLDVDLVRELMSRPSGMVTPSEMAALQGALEQIMRESVASDGGFDESRLTVLAQFLDACYAEPVVDKSLGFGISEGRYVMRSDLSPNFEILAKRVASTCGPDAAGERRTLAAWLEGATYNASSVYQVGDNRDLWIVTPEKGIKLRSVEGNGSLETYYDDCASGRRYALGGSGTYFETDRDLRFVVSRSGNSAWQTFDDFASVDVFTDSSGENPDLGEQVASYLSGNIDFASASVDVAVAKAFGGSNPMPDPLDLAAGVCFAFQARDAWTMNGLRDQASCELFESLAARRDSASEEEGLDACLNADGTVTEHPEWSQDGKN